MDSVTKVVDDMHRYGHITQELYDDIVDARAERIRLERWAAEAADSESEEQQSNERRAQESDDSDTFF